MTRKKILIVEDDESIQATIELSLEVTTNWTFLKASSGKEALLLAQTKQPDLILLDVMMPDFDGIEVLIQLRKNPTTQEIPVIFLTAKALAKEQQKLKDLDVQGVIPKPFDAVNLGEQICSLLNWESTENRNMS